MYTQIGGVHMDWSALASIFVTIIGFIITYSLTNKNLKDEISKTKTSIALEKMEDIPFDILSLLKDIKNGELNADNYASILHRIYAYCSPTAIKIAVKMQSLTYQQSVQSTSTSNFRMLTLLSLLISQVKYDLTNEIINPELWFIMQITDYNTSALKTEVKHLINEDIELLSLNKQFYVL